MDVVRGKMRVLVPRWQIEAVASKARRVVVDLGTGDGRWVYRMARSHPDFFCIGVDANAEGMREVSFRAGRKPSRGGAANAWFVCAAVDSLPAGLGRLADWITVLYPWGRLLRVVVDPDVPALIRIAAVGKPGAHVEVCINESALRAGVYGDPESPNSAGLIRRLAPAYAQGGILLAARTDAPGLGTTWAGRVGQGRPPTGVVLRGRVDTGSEGV